MSDAAWFEPVRAYCERTGPGFWDEPLNALSNGAFLIAAVVAALRAGQRDRAALALAGLVAVVGIGSFLFHTLANRWSLLADVIPIGVFIYAYFLLAMARFFALPSWLAAAVTLLFAGLSIGLVPALDAATGSATTALSNGSVDYLPALLALSGIGSVLVRQPGRAAVRTAQRAAGRLLLLSAGLFLVSLVFRTIDRAVCPWLPAGSHALWHVLNACLLYVLILAAIRFREQSGLPQDRIVGGVDRRATIADRRG